MIRIFCYSILLSCLCLSACSDSTQDASINIPMPTKGAATINLPALDQANYYDKVLGALVGSAIGDAMGASTEMWPRADIQKEYGYITDLTTALREKSPEGTWQHDMIAGATTDDTRWKMLVGIYLSKHQNQLSTDHFAAFISNYYQTLTSQLSNKELLQSTDILDEKIAQINWIKEWARLSLAYQEGPSSFYRVQHRFYGGEMSCAGMLYTPMFGLVEDTPLQAYETAFDHALFDIGYARDISGIVAAMTFTASRTSHMDSILNTHLYVDPYDYKDSRLIGRLAAVIAKESQDFVRAAALMELEEKSEIEVPEHYPGSVLDWVQEDFIFSKLEQKQKAIAFHAGEIWQILYTGLAYGAGDFERTMQFIVNYGRDNDTVAAVAGMILGAKDGFKKLPKRQREEVLKVNKEVMGIDLEEIARLITAEAS